MEHRHRQIIQHRGKTVIVQNYTGLAGQAYVDAVESNGKAGKTLDISEKRILVDVTDSVVDKDVMKAFKSVSKTASSKISKTAVVGVSGIQKILLRTVAAFAQLQINTFENRDEALEWLAGDDT